MTSQKGPAGLDAKQQIKFLKKIEFFENFDDHELRQFLAVTKWLKVPAGKQIIKENSVERVFYILVKGVVTVVKTVEGSKKTVELTTLESGACFGEISLVMDIKRTAGVITKSESFILMVEPRIISTSNVFLQLKFYKRFGEILASRLIQANERLAAVEKPADFGKMKEIKLPRDEDELASVNKEQGEDREQDLFQEQEQPTVMVLPPMPKKKDRIIKGQLQRRITGALELPANPKIAERLAPLLKGECTNTRLFADIVHLDPVLSSKVMQVANSSYFRRTTPVATVAHAMITVGIKHIQEALAETIEVAATQKPFSGFTDLTSSFWKHSVIVARIASMLKDLIRLDLPTDVYLAGLLHDIGFLVLDSIEPAFYPHLTDPDSVLNKNLFEAETTYIGIDHGLAGSWFGESIGLPAPFLDVMRFHLNPEKARENSLPTAIIHLANVFAKNHGSQIGSATKTQIPVIESYAWAIIQDHHRPFLEVNIADFIDSVNDEISKTWSSLTNDLEL